MDRFGSQARPLHAPSKSATELPPKPLHNGCTDVKPRLTKEQHDILEAHFQQQHKPSTSTKKGFAETLGVPLDKINNWFQNRRAKVKQDLKKQMNQMQMNMNMYGATGQMPMVAPQFPHTEQPQPPTMTQDFYSVNADISSTHLPVDGVEGQPAMEPLGSQLSLHQGFDMHPLRPIPEADRSASYSHHAVMQSFMAAAAGAPYMQNNATSLAPQESGFSYATNGLPQSFPGDLSFSIPATLPNENGVSHDLSSGFGDLSGFDYTSLTTTATSSSAPAQDSTGSISSEPSPFSGTQSTATTQSSGGPPASSVTSIASMYSNWKEDPNANTSVTSANENDDLFGHPYSLPQAAASEQTLPFWGSNGQPFSHGDMYQHTNASASAILSSPGEDESRKFSITSDLEPPPPFTEDGIYQRRNSSTSNLANTIEGIHIQSSTPPDGFKHPAQASSLASRRHKRPAALNSSTLRSASYTSGMSSPGANPNDHALRRIRSSGIPSAAGRVQKPNQSAAQRSPLNLTFAESAASPKFARTFSSSSSTTLGQGGSLAPPTPLTPGANEMSRFPSWQSNTIIKNHQPMPEHSSPESLNVNWTVEPQSASMYSHTASPPSTPLDLGQVNQARIANESMYRDTPPQSAPATQQGFSRTAFVAPPLMSTGFHSTSDLTIMQPKPSHFRRPSLPDTNNAQLDVPGMQFPVQLGGEFQMNFDHQFSGMAGNTQFTQSGGVPDFYVHEYSPPQGSGQAASRRAPEPQKNYIFANQGPHDFR